MSATKTRSGPSGKTLSRAQRQARGDVQVVVWLNADDARLLTELEDASGGTRAQVLRDGIHALARERGKVRKDA